MTDNVFPGSKTLHTAEVRLMGWIALLEYWNDISNFPVDWKVT